MTLVILPIGTSGYKEIQVILPIGASRTTKNIFRIFFEVTIIQQMSRAFFIQSFGFAFYFLGHLY